MQEARKGRLNPTVGAARGALASTLNDALGPCTVAPAGRATRNRQDASAQDVGIQQKNTAAPLVLVAVSGGPDSLALASLTAHLARRGDLRAGAIVVDHQLQKGS